MRLGTREAAVIAIYSKAAQELSDTFPLVTLANRHRQIEGQSIR